MQVAPMAVAVGRFAHDAFVLKAEAFIKMTCAGVVFEDVEEHPVRAEFPEGDPYQFLENAAPEAAFGNGYNDPLELNGAGVLVDAAQYYVSLHVVPFGFAEVVAGVPSRESSAVALFAPLADKFARHG